MFRIYVNILGYLSSSDTGYEWREKLRTEPLGQQILDAEGSEGPLHRGGKSIAISVEREIPNGKKMLSKNRSLKVEYSFCDLNPTTVIFITMVLK